MYWNHCRFKSSFKPDFVWSQNDSYYENNHLQTNSTGRDSSVENVTDYKFNGQSSITDGVKACFVFSTPSQKQTPTPILYAPTVLHGRIVKLATEI